jgi:hypothetical protein
VELNELTERQRKILKLIIVEGYDIGLLVNDGLSIDEAQEIYAKGMEKWIEKRITAQTDDINA